ncbi:MAG: hypothetical protein MI741_23620, partial [Rhodospirillales bacterium]|nr:hypothetical protein [Rhodospirillales bacterium]
MSRIPNNAPITPAGERKLRADSGRIRATGHAVLGGEIENEIQAIAMARAIADRLSALPPDARLTGKNSLMALADDLADLRDRLSAEKDEVEQELISRS